jgi:ABC-type nitrate/sulfonate/bicarbonate transport system permease component
MKRTHVLLSALLLGMVWQILAMILDVSILPDLITVMKAFIEEFPGELGGHFFASMWRVIASLGLSISIAAPLGLFLGQSQRLNRLLSPMLYLLYPIPKVVLLPIVILFLGIGNLSKIVVISMILFFQILVLVRDQASAIRPELLYSVRSLGAGRRALFRFVYFPASVPAILTAIRQSIGTAVAVLYVAELFATRKGLGYYIYLHGSTLFDYPKMYAGVISMSILGLGLYFLTDWLHRKLCPWQYAS